MSDINTVWHNDVDGGRGDFQMFGADLASGNDLMTAILNSLFSDRLARTDDALPDPRSTDRRGWWGDSNLGSRLWLLDREKLTPAVAKRAKDYATEALQWLIDDGAVARFVIETEIKVPSRLYMQVTAYRDGAANYAWVWSGDVLAPPSDRMPARGRIVTEDGFNLVTEDGTIITA